MFLGFFALDFFFLFSLLLLFVWLLVLLSVSLLLLLFASLERRLSAIICDRCLYFFCLAATKADVAFLGGDQCSNRVFVPFRSVVVCFLSGSE